jgi:membrane protease subunit (stomatin/prohibitin family)
MKTVIMAIAILLAASTTTFAQAKQGTAQKQKSTKVATKYTCEMHPEVVKSKPGKCPKCGMNLTAIKSKKTTTTKKTDTKS